MIVEPARRDEFLALMQETYGQAMTPAEFDWWFDRNPAGPRILNEARDDDGTALGVLAMSFARDDAGARGVRRARGDDAGSAGTRRLLGTRAPQRGRGGSRRRRLGARLHEPDGGADPRRQARLGGRHVAAHLGAAEALAEAARPPARARVSSRSRKRGRRGRRTSSFATSPTSTGATSTRRGPMRASTTSSSRIRCGTGSRRPSCASTAAGLGRAVRLVDADIAVAMVNPGEERRFLAAGFVPTPRTIRFIGKRLHDDAPELPKRRDAWYFTLGDLDFF